MELRHLRYFTAVAEELHFTRAAARLGIRQPPLSAQIRQLEREMGTPLLRRLTRGVELTDAGRLLLDQARAILQQVEQAKADVQRCIRGETGHLHVGFASATYFPAVVAAIFRDFTQRYPGVTISPEQSTSPSLADGLRAGRIDMALIRPPVSGTDGLALDLLVEEDMLVALPAAHALARRKAVPLDALAAETFILFPRAAGPGLYDLVISACRAAGFSPRIGPEAPQIVASVAMVAAGFGIALVPRSVGQIQIEGTVYRPIAGEAPRAPIMLAHRRDDRSPAVRSFVTLARQQVRAER
jgi:DNA-binding transcriptional LysR family regulator